MTTMELKARQMDIMQALIQLDNEKLAKAEKYIHKLLNESKIQTFNMSSDLLNTLLDNAEENRKNGICIEEQEMNNFIDSLQ